MPVQYKSRILDSPHWLLHAPSNFAIASPMASLDCMQYVSLKEVSHPVKHDERDKTSSFIKSVDNHITEADQLFTMFGTVAVSGGCRALYTCKLTCGFWPVTSLPSTTTCSVQFLSACKWIATELKVLTLMLPGTSLPVQQHHDKV